MITTSRFALSAVVAFTTLATACGGGGSEGGGGVFGRSRASGTVAVVLQDVVTPAGLELRTGLQAAAKAHDLTIAVEPSNGDPARAQALVSKAIADKAVAIVVDAADSTAAATFAAAASRAGIPYFAIGVPAGPSGAAGQVASHADIDHYAAARVAAEYLAGYLGNRGGLLLVRPPGTHGARELEQGFAAGIKDHTGLQLTAVIDAGDQAAAAAAVTAALRSTKGIKGIFATTPELTLGANQGAIGARRADVAIVGMEMNELVRAAVANAAEAPIKALVVSRPRVLGEQVMEQVALRLSDEPVAAEIRVPVRLVTADSSRQAP